MQAAKRLVPMARAATQEAPVQQTTCAALQVNSPVPTAAEAVAIPEIHVLPPQPVLKYVLHLLDVCNPLSHVVLRVAIQE